MEERERMETVPMGNGSKEELFEKGHPVIRELKSIPEIIFEEQIGMLPSSAIPVKSLFARKQMDHLSRIMNGIRKMREFLGMLLYLMRRCSRLQTIV